MRNLISSLVVLLLPFIVLAAPAPIYKPHKHIEQHELAGEYNYSEYGSSSKRMRFTLSSSGNYNGNWEGEVYVGKWWFNKSDSEIVVDEWLLNSKDKVGRLTWRMKVTKVYGKPKTERFIKVR